MLYLRLERHNIFEFLSNKFKQSKAIYLYFFNSALSVYLQKIVFNHRQYNYYHRADARMSPRHQSLASCCSLVLLTGVNRSTRVAHIWPKDQSPSSVGRISYRDAPLEPPFHTVGAWLSDTFSIAAAAADSERDLLVTVTVTVTA